MAQMKIRRLPAGRENGRAVVAPHFSLAEAAWVPSVVIWDPATGEFRRVEGPRGFASYGRGEPVPGNALRPRVATTCIDKS
jgi:hypothetical protein